jgi:hypothetical protein
MPSAPEAISGVQEKSEKTQSKSDDNTSDMTADKNSGKPSDSATKKKFPYEEE